MAKKNSGAKIALPSGHGTINVSNSAIKNVGTAVNQLDSQATLVKSLGAFKTGVEDYKNALTKFMTGDNGKAYWQGESAFDWFDDAKDVLNALVRNYEDFRFCVDLYARLVGQARVLQKNDGKKLKPAFLKMLGDDMKPKVSLPMDINNLHMTSVIGVNKNEVTTQKTQEAGSAYRDMKTAIENISSACTKMKSAWGKVAENTTGGLYHFANERGQNRCATRIQALSDIKGDMADYTFDLVFTL